MRLVTETDGNVYEYTENIWTGKKELTFNGVSLQKFDKKTFIVNGNDSTMRMIKVKGNFLTGVTLIAEWGNIVMAKNKWYDWLLIFLPVFGLFVGIFGGAIGGGLSGLFGVLGCYFNANVLRSRLSLPLKILVCILIFVAANAAWILIYALIVGGISNLLGAIR